MTTIVDRAMVLPIVTVILDELGKQCSVTYTITQSIHELQLTVTMCELATLTINVNMTENQVGEIGIDCSDPQILSHKRITDLRSDAIITRTKTNQRLANHLFPPVRVLVSMIRGMVKRTFERMWAIYLETNLISEFKTMTGGRAIDWHMKLTWKLGNLLHLTVGSRCLVKLKLLVGALRHRGQDYINTSLEIRNDFGDTPLMRAVRHVKYTPSLANLDIVMYLILVCGADFQQCMSKLHGLTVLDVAIANRWLPPLITSMIQKGTQCGTTTDTQKWSFMEWCILRNNTTYLRVLIKAWDKMNLNKQLWSTQADGKLFSDKIDKIQARNSTACDGGRKFVDQRQCHNCHRIYFQINKLRKCGRCQDVRYCDQECQRKDWRQLKGHRIKCILFIYEID
jgi:hypothetical protein